MERSVFSFVMLLNVKLLGKILNDFSFQSMLVSLVKDKRMGALMDYEKAQGINILSCKDVICGMCHNTESLAGKKSFDMFLEEAMGHDRVLKSFILMSLDVMNAEIQISKDDIMEILNSELATCSSVLDSFTNSVTGDPGFKEMMKDLEDFVKSMFEEEGTAEQFAEHGKCLVCGADIPNCTCRLN